LKQGDNQQIEDVYKQQILNDKLHAVADTSCCLKNKSPFDMIIGILLINK
jgi:hypothetical protein